MKNNIDRYTLINAGLSTVASWIFALALSGYLWSLVNHWQITCANTLAYALVLVILFKTVSWEDQTVLRSLIYTAIMVMSMVMAVLLLSCIGVHKIYEGENWVRVTAMIVGFSLTAFFFNEIFEIHLFQRIKNGFNLLLAGASGGD